MVDIKKIDRKKSKHATTENHPITKKQSNQEERDRTITKQPKHQNKMKYEIHTCQNFCSHAITVNASVNILMHTFV